MALLSPHRCAFLATSANMSPCILHGICLMCTQQCSHASSHDLLPLIGAMATACCSILYRQDPEVVRGQLHVTVCRVAAATGLVGVVLSQGAVTQVFMDATALSSCPAQNGVCIPVRWGSIYLVPCCAVLSHSMQPNLLSHVLRVQCSFSHKGAGDELRCTCQGGRVDLHVF